MVIRSVGRRGVGRRRAMSDGGRRTDGSFYFFLEPPKKRGKMRKNNLKNVNFQMLVKLCVISTPRLVVLYIFL